MTVINENKLELQTFTLGLWMTNCYVIAASDKTCWIIDAGFEPQSMIEYIRENELEPTRLILTHAHLDHIAGVNEVREAFPDIPIHIHEAEKEFLTDTTLNLSAEFGFPVMAPQADHFIAHGDVLELADIPFYVRHTPGHSPGGICLYQPGNQFVIAGDTLFTGSVGRYDFPTSDGPALMNSIKTQLYTLPPETVVYPGHGDHTNIGHEMATNPIIRG